MDSCYVIFTLSLVSVVCFPTLATCQLSVDDIHRIVRVRASSGRHW